MLTELEIPHIYHSCARKSPKRPAMEAKWGVGQYPYIEDPNTGVAMFETPEVEFRPHLLITIVIDVSNSGLGSISAPETSRSKFTLQKPNSSPLLPARMFSRAHMLAASGGMLWSEEPLRRCPERGASLRADQQVHPADIRGLIKAVQSAAPDFVPGIMKAAVCAAL